MAQTKRKRRTKHRGNAAGGIEARGRTGRRLTPEEQKRAARGTGRNARVLKAPTWKSAAMKSSAMAALLFVMTQLGFLVKNATVGSGIAVAAIAMVLYTPLAYTTDKWAYNRQQRRMANQGRS